ncbi:hypothetical protein F5Y06DRAFT_304653 [Hypoxylon sp. FL0890]|nr:hypothetical protein F5Y06DRAFT_304653 [Hypoxylon sp. FL0890]
MGSLDKKNLTRIRDNQRRSRARHREYVAGMWQNMLFNGFQPLFPEPQPFCGLCNTRANPLYSPSDFGFSTHAELETRLKQFERQGAEITHAIQQVARRVADDNKKMRALLNSLGYNNERISSFLQTGNFNPPEATSSNSSQEQGDRIRTLELLLVSHYPEEPDSKSDKSSSKPNSTMRNSVENNVSSLAYGQAETGTLDTSSHDCIQLHGAQLSDANMLEFEPQSHSQYSTSSMSASNILNGQLQHSLGLIEETSNIGLDQAIQYGTDLICQDIMYGEQEINTYRSTFWRRIFSLFAFSL